jgi:hypothetical protein
MNVKEKTEGLRKINDLDFIYLQRGLLDRRLLSIDETNRLVVLYKTYLVLCFLYPKHINVPSNDVAYFWRNHISYTEMYRKDCKKIFGEYLDHDPDLTNNSKGGIADYSEKELGKLKELGINTVGVLASPENWNDGYRVG